MADIIHEVEERELKKTEKEQERLRKEEERDSKKTLKPKKLFTKESFVEFILEGRKLSRAAFFSEVNEVEERNNKKKYSIENKEDEVPTKSTRKRSSKSDETMDELIARIARELEDESANTMSALKNRKCTKCAIMPVDQRYIIDKDLGYCEECADILHLGESKEARKMDYQLSLLGDENEDAGPEYGGF